MSRTAALGAPHADLSRAEEARWPDFGRLFDSRPEAAGLDLRGQSRVTRTARPTRSTASTTARGLYREQSELHRQGDGADACGTRRPRRSSTTSRPRSSGCSTPSSTPSPATGPTTTRRRCAPRSTPSTSASITTSTTACIARASPSRRRPTRRPTTGCSPRSTGWRSGCRGSAISSATRSPRPTGGCSRRWCASTSPISRSSSATGSASPTIRTWRTTCASSTRCRASPAP